MTAQNNASPNAIPNAATQAAGLSPGYRVDDQDARPWGHYIVKAVGMDGGEEYCEKLIVIKPGKALSLQSHDLRRERWTVRSGILTALLDGKRIEAVSGQAILVPRGSIHCMANLTEEDCVVEERQSGICREEDIRRYADAYSRSTEAPRPGSAAALAAYQALLEDIRRAGASREKHARR